MVGRIGWREDLLEGGFAGVSFVFSCFRSEHTLSFIDGARGLAHLLAGSVSRGSPSDSIGGSRTHLGLQQHSPIFLVLRQMIHYRGHNHLLMKNKDVGIFNQLFIVDADGSIVDVSDIVFDPSILNSVEQRVDANESDIDFLKQIVNDMSTELGLLEQRVTALEAGGGGTIDNDLLHQVLVRLSTLENNFNINEHF